MRNKSFPFGPKKSDRAPATSWWLDAPREGFTQHVEEIHVPRMHGSRFGLLGERLSVGSRGAEAKSEDNDRFRSRVGHVKTNRAYAHVGPPGSEFKQAYEFLAGAGDE